MDDLPDGFMQVNDDMLSNEDFMQPFLDAAQRGNQNVLCVRTEDGKFHRVMGTEMDGFDGFRFYFNEDIGETIPGNPRNDSLTLQNIIENPMRFTLYANSAFGGNGGGGPAASSGHAMTSSMVV